MLTVLRATKGSLTLAELASAAFGYKSMVQGNSWTRNSLRRLICSRLVTKMDARIYRINTKVPAKKK